MPIRRRTAVAPVVAVLLLGVAACGGSDSDTKSSPPTTKPPTSPTSATTTDGGSGGLPDGFGAGPAGSGLQRFYTQQVDWQQCDQGQCARVWVPLDYGDPNGKAITVEMAKREASGSSKLGSLFINPGGPGVSGVDFVTGNPLDDNLLSHYDVVGFDPRGVARSTPIDCVSDSQLDDFIAADPAPDGPAEIKPLEDMWSDYVQGCTDRSGPLLSHVSTVDVARDLDVMRSLVGDPKLNYFGFSYGTYIGATYAGLFPGKVGRMVLDGAIDPEQPPLETQLRQTEGFETALTAYLEYCIAQGNCPLGDSVAAGRGNLNDLLASIAASPLPTQSGRLVTEGIAVYGVIFPLYDQAAWPYETQAIIAAQQGHGDVLAVIADAYTARAPDGSYRSNQVEAQAPINCLDNPQHESVAEILAGEKRFERAAPVFGRIGAWFPYACSNWPYTADEPKPDFSASGAAPIVVVGTTRDPATPYEQAVALARELDSGVLITRNGDGHTGYGKGNDCVDSAVDTYLVDGQPPKDGLTC